MTAERALLARLEAGCAAPIGACARVVGPSLVLDAVVCKPDGTAQLRRSLALALPAGQRPLDVIARLEVAARLGAMLADELLASGASELAELGVVR